jgi:hypothetical protein
VVYEAATGSEEGKEEFAKIHLHANIKVLPIFIFVA